MMIETSSRCSDRHNDNLQSDGKQTQAQAELVMSESSRICRTSTHRQSHHPRHSLRPSIVINNQVLNSSRQHCRSPRSSLYITFILLITCYCSFVAATPALPASISNPLEDASDDLRLTLAQLAESGTILVDQQPPPQIPGSHWRLESVEERSLQRRLNSNSTSNSTVAATPTAGGIVAAGTSGPSPIPSPFDSSLGSNFSSQACPSYINRFIGDPAFKACLPFSLLLQSSQSFFQAEKSLVRITQTLDATCAANVSTCDILMQSLALNLTTDANCGADFRNGNPTVVQARTGLIAYKPLYQASCLRNPSSQSYCFADAVTNASSPTDSYVYYTALNSSLPGGTTPTCNACLQNTMAVFEAAAANRSQPVSGTYVNTAAQVNILCGPTFVNASLPAPISGAMASTSISHGVGILALALYIIAWML